MAWSKNIDQEITPDEGVEISQEGKELVFKGPKGENRRVIFNPLITVEVKDNKVILKPKSKGGKRENKTIKTFKSHIENLIRGVKEGHTYKMKVCSGHFPMNISQSNGQIVVKNYLGEKVPRTYDVPEDVKVNIEGEDITVESVDKERAGMVASDLELLTRRPGFDERVFQDGIYITEKDGKNIG
ncbi:MAG: 50S ribosomal protein L6 [Nanobdellota archaeon]